MRRTKAQAAVTRRAILAAAEELFFRKGVDRCSIEDIASAANLTRGAVNFHFENKTAIFAQIFNEAVPAKLRLTARDRDANCELGSLARARRLSREWLAALIRDRQRQHLMTILLRTIQEDLSLVRAYLDAYESEYVQTIRSEFDRAASRSELSDRWTPCSATEAVRRFLQGTVSDWLLRGDGFALSPCAEDVLDRLFVSFTDESER